MDNSKWQALTCAHIYYIHTHTYIYMHIYIIHKQEKRKKKIEDKTPLQKTTDNFKKDNAYANFWK